MNKHNFKLFILFSFIAFSSANNYSMLRRTPPQISTLPFIALRHCSTATPKPQEAAQTNEIPKITKEETKYSGTRMHQDDMDEIKHHIKNNKVNYLFIWCIGLWTGLITRSHK